jgi:SAM-dependent methyltransferase
MRFITKRIKSFVLFSSWIWDPMYRTAYKITKRKNIRIPSLRNRHRVGSWKIGRFIEGGYLGFLPIKKTIEKYYEENNINILDFGAGVGRTLMHMKTHYENLYAVDVDKSAINYLKRNYSSIIAFKNNYEPPLLFRDGLFDVVYSVSIWTHLPPSFQIPWLLELKRILKLGGVALITTSGFKALHLRQRRDEEWRNVTDLELEKKGIIYREYPNFKVNAPDFPGIKVSYGLTAHSPSYIEKEWSKYFKVLEIQEGVIDNIQDLIVLKNEY